MRHRSCELTSAVLCGSLSIKSRPFKDRFTRISDVSVPYQCRPSVMRVNGSISNTNDDVSVPDIARTALIRD
jgi:hypothetical protein